MVLLHFRVSCYFEELVFTYFSILFLSQLFTLNFDPASCRNESEVESKLIVHYLLPKLGYSPETWHQEVAFGRIRLDFLAFATQVLPFKVDADSPLSVVIEAKHPKENLDKHIWRLRRYLTAMNIRYGLLTNGREIRIYKRKQYLLELVFRCLGREVADKIEEIKAIIGRESIAKSTKITLQQPTPQPLVITDSKPGLERSTMKTIAIYHHKGGVGKTTIAVNLAAALRRKGKRVLLVDIDAQANSTFATGLIKFTSEEDDDLKESNVYHLLQSGEFGLISEISRKSRYFNNPEIDVIPSHIDLIEKQAELRDIVIAPTRLFKKLKQVKSEYDVAIVDAPPSMDLYAQAALIAADYLIIPSDLKPFSNQGLVSVSNFIKDRIKEPKEYLDTSLEIVGVLPSKISPNPMYLKHTYPKQKAVITERYNLPLMESMISERSALAHCINKTLPMGNLEVPDPKSIFNYADNHSDGNVSAAEFEMLAIEVLEKMEK